MLWAYIFKLICYHQKNTVEETADFLKTAKTLARKATANLNQRSVFPQNARIITAQALIASITATIIAFDAGCNNFTETIDTEIIIVANITIAGAITHGILSAISKRCCIFISPCPFWAPSFVNQLIIILSKYRIWRRLSVGGFQDVVFSRCDFRCDFRLWASADQKSFSIIVKFSYEII